MTVNIAEIDLSQAAYTPKQVCFAVGITYRQMQYWDKTDLVTATYHKRGKYRIYSLVDMFDGRIANLLRGEYGISIQNIRKIMESLRSLRKEQNVNLLETNILIDHYEKKNEHPYQPMIILFRGTVIHNYDTDPLIIQSKVILEDLVSKLTQHLPAR